MVFTAKLRAIEAYFCAIESLPAAYGEVIILRHLEELSFPEIARRLGRSLDSVKKLWVRGLAQLREHLEDAP